MNFLLSKLRNFGYNFAQGRRYLGNPEGIQSEKTVSYTIHQVYKTIIFGWTIWQNLQDSMKIVSDNGKTLLPYSAKDVYIVASGSGTDIPILLYGKTVTSDDAGQDLKNGLVSISEHRLYNIISPKQSGSHTLTIISYLGFEIYMFTFG